ncbi:hypothetical protein C6988_02440 [Nitrosopumilus sp. b1]|uniref:hypothetical protein n=1 Tax=Nitrosopumilus sp. b1 TaxID=2109907 RepID=UPI0015F63EC9|nr:hypothetical protein [Nitrosopumilus sp. b1]KAF6243622.1 hypothetical protein C6988_02440 [Nitrosopumilus sp. b1]
MNLLPLSANFDASLLYQREDKNYHFDITTLQPRTSKIEVYGKLKKRKILIMCDGNGKFKIREIKKMQDRLKEIKKLLEEKQISNKEYNKFKKSILKDEFE